MQINVSDSNLSSLASYAAVELDLLIQGEETGLEAVRELGERLRQTVSEDSTDSSKRRLQVDTETETILGQAFLEAREENPKTILDDLLERTEKIASEMTTDESSMKDDEEALKWQLAFCLALSKFSAAHRQMLSATRPRHPNRR